MFGLEDWLMSLEEVKKMQRKGSMREVLVQATTPEYWKVNKKHKFCSQKHTGRGMPKDVQYVAFYRTDEKAITHMAKVKKTNSKVPFKRAYAKTSLPKEEIDRHKKGELDKIYYIREPFWLPRIVRGEGPGLRDYRYTTLENLLTAETIKDL